MRRNALVSKAAGSKQFRRAVISKLEITALRQPASGWPMNSYFFLPKQLGGIVLRLQDPPDSYQCRTGRLRGTAPIRPTSLGCL